MKNIFRIALLFCFAASLSASASSTVKNCDEDVGYAVVDDNGTATCFAQELAYQPFGFEPCADIQPVFVLNALEPVVVFALDANRQDAERIRWQTNEASLAKNLDTCESLVYFDDHPKG